MEKILLIEDDRTFSRIVTVFLTKLHYSVIAALTGKEGLAELRRGNYGLVLLDYRLPDLDGMDMLRLIKAEQPEVPVIIMTSFSDLRTAVKCIKAGAFEYVTKPVNPDELQLLVEQAINKKMMMNEPVEKKKSSVFFKGNSRVSEQLYEYLKLVAPTEMSIIIEGESGTGKEHIANSIHQLSNRSGGPFVALDCGALSKELAASELFGHIKGSFTGALANKVGQLEFAQGGTLFLDEVGNLPYDIQVKLLRAIQERVIQPLGSNNEIKIDVRIITATNENLVNASKEGSFREDLFHRLNEFKIQVPALRERGEDVIGFAEFFRIKANDELSKNTTAFSEEMLNFYRAYKWPGNLRELKNSVRRSVLLSTSSIIGKETLPMEMFESTIDRDEEIDSNGFDLKALQEKSEREKIQKILQEVKYNKSKAARILNIDRKTLYIKMERYGIE